MAVKVQKTGEARLRRTSELSRVLVNRDEAPRYYSNSIIITPAFFDFRMEFGEVLEVRGDEMVIREQAVIYISPQHAKALFELLKGRIALYEGLFGEIPKAPDEPKIADE